MIDFYGLTSPNVVKIFVMLEECGLPYNFIPIDVYQGHQFTAEFTRLNPNQKIPVIVDSDGPGGKPITVFESGAILIYLAEKTGRFIPKDPAERYEMLQWFMIQIASVGPMSGQLVHFSQFAPAGNEYGHARYRSEVNRLFDLIETRLSSHPYVAGSSYSIADIAHWSWLRRHETLGINLASRPHVKAWLQTIAAREAVKRAIAKVDTVKSTRDTANADQLDRFFNRGKYQRA